MAPGEGSHRLQQAGATLSNCLSGNGVLKLLKKISCADIRITFNSNYWILFNNFMNGKSCMGSQEIPPKPIIRNI